MSLKIAFSRKTCGTALLRAGERLFSGVSALFNANQNEIQFNYEMMSDLMDQKIAFCTEPCAALIVFTGVWLRMNPLMAD